MPHYEKASRSISKTITYRVAVTICNAIIIYIPTQDLQLTTNLSLIIAAANTAVYFFHERAWNHINWGRHKQK